MYILFQIFFMKTTHTFRLNPSVQNLLHTLADMMKTNKTHIIENAVKHYAKSQKINPLIKCCGILSDKQADSIFDDIYSTRVNKTKPPLL